MREKQREAGIFSFLFDYEERKEPEGYEKSEVLKILGISKIVEYVKFGIGLKKE